MSNTIIPGPAADPAAAASRVPEDPHARGWASAEARTAARGDLERRARRVELRASGLPEGSRARAEAEDEAADLWQQAADLDTAGAEAHHGH